MKDIVSVNSNRNIKSIPLVFNCKCGERFISNEYREGGSRLCVGGSMKTRTAKDMCPTCGNEIEGGRIYSPIIGSEEYEKWYGNE